MEEQNQNTKNDSGLPKDILQFVCFKLAEEEYAIDISLIMEVIKILPVTPVPQVPDFCLGLINCRGTIIPLFDLRIKVRLPQKPFDSKSRILIANVGQDFIGLVIDEILDNIRVETNQVDLTKYLAMKIGKEYICGVARVEDRMVAILDFQRMHSVIFEEMTSTHVQP